MKHHTVPCAFCTSPVRADRSSWHKVTGWERAAQGPTRASGSDIILRESQGDYACVGCIEKMKAGLSVGQESLV